MSDDLFLDLASIYALPVGFSRQQFDALTPDQLRTLAGNRAVELQAAGVLQPSFLAALLPGDRAATVASVAPLAAVAATGPLMTAPQLQGGYIAGLPASDSQGRRSWLLPVGLAAALAFALRRSR